MSSTDLIQRLTDATVNERGLFEEAANLLMPAHAPDEKSYWAWRKWHDPFHRMLDAEAWTSAAEMLVPADAKLSYQNHGAGPPHSHMWLVSPNERYVSGHTSALALLIAALKAHGGNDAE